MVAVFLSGPKHLLSVNGASLSLDADHSFSNSPGGHANALNTFIRTYGSDAVFAMGDPSHEDLAFLITDQRRSVDPAAFAPFKNGCIEFTRNDLEGNVRKMMPFLTSGHDPEIS